MGRNRIRDQYQKVAVLLRRMEHVDNDYENQPLSLIEKNLKEKKEDK